MRSRQLKAVAVALALFLATCEAEEQRESGDLGSAFAARVEGLLAATKETSYQHLTSIDEEHGVVLCDCSGLIGYMLRQQFPEAYVSLRGDEAPWRNRPLAVTYYETFVAAGLQPDEPACWRKISMLRDVVPGDVIAWRKPTIHRESTTGHVLMVAGLPEVVEEGLVRVRIIDSTRSSTRRGFGDGFKTFTVNEAGEPTGYLVGKKRMPWMIAAGRMLDSPSTVIIADDIDFIGKTISEATELAKERKMKWRIIRDQSVPNRVGWKIDTARLNFVIEDNKIVRVLRG